jgi:hypothetical protein
MPRKFLWRVVLAVILSVTLVIPARANGFGEVEHAVIAGIVVVSAGIAVLVTFLILHHKNKKSSITGCVVSEANGLNLTDTKDHQTYLLSGELSAVKTGDQMTLLGKRKRPGGKQVFETQSVTRDFGACKP